LDSKFQARLEKTVEQTAAELVTENNCNLLLAHKDIAKFAQDIISNAYRDVS
jgi:hypothetical protein